MLRRTSTNCAAASNTFKQTEGKTMTENWKNNLLAALVMLGAGLEGVGLEMA